MKNEKDRVDQYQSAYLSNTKAFNEKMEEITVELRAKEEAIERKTKENHELIEMCDRLKEEANTFKGRLGTLQRDFQVSQSYL